MRLLFKPFPLPGQQDGLQRASEGIGPSAAPNSHVTWAPGSSFQPDMGGSPFFALPPFPLLLPLPPSYGREHPDICRTIYAYNHICMMERLYRKDAEKYGGE